MSKWSWTNRTFHDLIPHQGRTGNCPLKLFWELKEKPVPSKNLGLILSTAGPLDFQTFRRL